jgi:phosphoribosylamine--glycine ligase
MKVLIIGSGGREHALAWKLADSPSVTGVYALPGNPGIGQVAELIPGDVMDFAGIGKVAKDLGVGLVVVGPEDPLAAGIADFLAETGIRVFGPGKSAAQLEADKWFAKELMRHQAVPTAEARSFTHPEAAEEYVRAHDAPVVIKAAGLAKGKGVTLCYRTKDALETIDRLMRQKAFGEAGGRIIVEELLTGPECSILAFVDRSSIYLMESAQDHKAVDDGDTGPMTGGMGAYSPAPIVTEDIIRQVERDVFVPVLDGLRRDDIVYNGVLYAGLMLTAAGPKVLEFNCRFGDPETQPLMMRLKSDLLPVLLATAENRLRDVDLVWDPRPALCVVAAAKGYPGSYARGDRIEGLVGAAARRDVQVFHAGTRLQDGSVVTDGGRVLSVCALGDTIEQCAKRAYEALGAIHFKGMHYRKDIGRRAMLG